MNTNKAINWALGIGILGLILYLAWAPAAQWWDVHRAIQNIQNSRDVTKAHQTLINLDDRQYVLDKLTDALHDSDGGVQAKENILRTFAYFKEHRVVRRAVRSDSVNARRAAIWIGQGDQTIRADASKIALAWLKDTGADMRSRAAILCGRFNVKEAEPILLKLLDTKPANAQELELLRHTLGALRGFKPEGLAGRLMKLLGNKGQPESVRAEAISTLASLPDAPRDELRKIAIGIITDRSQGALMRGRVTGLLQRKAYAGEDTWEALRSVVLDKKETDSVIQRMCLNALGYTYPLDRLETLLKNKQVYNHRYFAIKMDVAIALAALDARDRITLEILCTYLEDSNPEDTRHQVAEEAYLSVWALTGGIFDADLPRDLFSRPPRRIRDPERARAYLWMSSISRYFRPSPEQVKAIEKLAQDRGKMKTIAQNVRSRIGQIEDTWAKAKKADEERKKQAEGNEKKVEPSGPTKGK